MAYKWGLYTNLVTKWDDPPIKGEIDQIPQAYPRSVGPPLPPIQEVTLLHPKQRRIFP